MNETSSARSRSKLFRIVRAVLYSLFAMFLFLAFIFGGGWVFYNPDYTVEDVVYGQRHGHELVMNVISPEDPNGAGVFMMISGRWKSRDEDIDPWPAAPLLRKGYTLFLVRHVSQPEATVMETVADVKRAVRYVRYHADQFNIDPDRLGISGGSSGGHLSLMVATTGDDGDPDSADPIERESSRVRAAAVFYPVTDLIDLGESTENLRDGGPPKSYVKAFGMESRDPDPWIPVGEAMSPIKHITPELPPILIFHGTADTLVPYDQSTRFAAEAKNQGLEVKVIPREGKKHGWPTMILDVFKISRFYDKHLRK